ncbi:MAG: DUF4038 domain-containing protein [Thermoguttaceae bacterium]
MRTFISSKKPSALHALFLAAAAAALAFAGAPVARGADAPVSIAKAGQPSAAEPVYPVKVSANGRYLVDQNNAPYLIAGDSTQALTTNISTVDAEMFFADRQAHGFNSDWVNLLTAGSEMAGRNDGSTYDGIRPFTGYVPGGTDYTHFDLTTPNEAFFARVDQMINLAAKYKIQIILDPAETIAWLPALLNNGTAKCRAFGQYLGNRYKNFDNILWMSGNDFEHWQDPRNDAVVTSLALGIKERDTRHIHTVELHIGKSVSTDDPKWVPIVSLNAAYCYGPPYIQVVKGYNNPAKKMPVFMVEAVYEFEGNAQPKTSTPSTLRRQEYWSILSGATGQLYGNGYTWPFKQGWKSHLDTPGAAQIIYLKSFFESRPWYDLVPDQTHSTLMAGYGTMITDKNYVGGVDSNDYATAARTEDGSLVLAYLPTPRTVTIDMTKLRGPTTARWFDPSNGAYTAIAGSPLANTESCSFTPPGKNHDGDGDWVLALEATGATASSTSTQRAAGSPPIAPSGRIAKGQRVFSTGHSFHAGFAPILDGISKSAGFEGSSVIGISNIGGSKVIQHWGRKEVQAALTAGAVDVLMTTPIYLPDPGVEKFAQLGFEHNPNFRLTMMEFWLPFDQYEPRYYVYGPEHLPSPKSVDHNAATGDGLRRIHQRYVREMDDLVSAVNKKLGKQVVFVVPVGQAVLALREKIIAGKVPGLKSQEDLFADGLGHPKPPLTVLMGYCHYAVIYRKSPVGLPVPQALSVSGDRLNLVALNRLLQELAWDAVTHHSLSGVSAQPIANADERTAVRANH